MLLLALIACTTRDEPIEAVRVDPVPDPVVEAPAEPAAPAGPAFLAVQGSGIFRWDQAGVRKLANLAEIGDVALAGDQLWAVADKALWRTESDGMGRLAAIPSVIDPGGIAVGPDGRVWITGFEELWAWDGTTLAEASRPGIEPLDDVAVGPDGTVWVSARNKVASGDGVGPWTVHDLGAVTPGLTFLGDLVVTPSGEVYVNFIGDKTGLLVLRGGSWTVVAGESGYSSKGEALALAADGRVVVQAADGARVLADPPIAVDDDRGYRAFDVTAVAVDARDRVWLGTDLGPVVVPKQGEPRQFTPGTLPGVEGEITRIRVVAGGPAIAAGSAARGTVTGRLLDAGGAPVAGVDIAFCDDSALLYTHHPCEGATLRVDGKTDGGGRFRLADVPFGSMPLLARLDPEGKPDKWTQVFGVGCCTGVRADKPLDLGDIQLSP